MTTNHILRSIVFFIGMIGYIPSFILCSIWAGIKGAYVDIKNI